MRRLDRGSERAYYCTVVYTHTHTKIETLVSRIDMHAFESGGASTAAEGPADWEPLWWAQREAETKRMSVGATNTRRTTRSRPLTANDAQQLSGAQGVCVGCGRTPSQCAAIGG